MKSGITPGAGGIPGKSVIEAVRQLRLSVLSTRTSPSQERQEAQSSPSHVVLDN